MFDANNPISRRSLLRGLGGAALSMLAQREAGAATHFEAKAKRVIYLFQSGGPSQVDTFDFKPELIRRAGERLPKSALEGQRQTTFSSGLGSFRLMPPVAPFSRRGASGAWVSQLLPHTGSVVDQLCLIRSLHHQSINHDPAMNLLNTGAEALGRPSAGAWLGYGLGAISDDLPTFVAMISRPSWGQAQPVNANLWSSGFLPAAHQGVKLNSVGQPVLYLKGGAGDSNEALVGAINALNGQRPHTAQLEARIASYEMAFRMQASVPSLVDLSDESPGTLQRYGPEASRRGTYAASCLLARRLIERGVRMVQIFHRGWDHHDRLGQLLPESCAQTDQATAALITDLAERGLLEDTLVIWGGEFGRTAYAQGDPADPQSGRDHHPYCFTIWMAGGGIKPGLQYGRTNEFSTAVVEDPLHVHDLHATVLHLLGLDHHKLKYRHQGRDHRLTDVGGRVVRALLA